MQRVFDDRHRPLAFATAPQRIVSLVPSDTYSVAALGCADALVGRTDYCVLPENVRAKVPSVGGTKNPRIADILALSPDLVIANQEENSRRDLEALAQAGIRVLVVFPKRVADGLSGLARLARILGVEKTANTRDLIGRGYEELRGFPGLPGQSVVTAELPTTAPKLRVFCPIWMDPLMTIHGTTFISDVLAEAGADNVFSNRTRLYPLAADYGIAPSWAEDRVGERDIRYPRITLDELISKAPELILLPDEPHPFSAEDAKVFRSLPVPAAESENIVHTDGKDLCWYGAWTIGALSRVRAVIAAARVRTLS